MMRVRRILVIIALAGAWSWAWLGPQPVMLQALAQRGTGLDQTTFIEGLEQRGMNDLILRLIEADPSDDPAENLYLQFAQHRLNSRTLAQQAREALQAREQTRYEDLTRRSKTEIDRALETLVQLIEEQRDHNTRPIWQTDLVQMWLESYMQDFYELALPSYAYGQPTREQREVFERIVPKALEMTVDADARFRMLRDRLPREPDHVQLRVNTGLWDRMIDQYWMQLTQYYLARSAYLATLLPDDHPYFQQRNPRIPNQASQPQQERQRLLDDAVYRLEDAFVEGNVRANVRELALSLLAQIHVRQGNDDRAIQRADEVLANNTGSVAHLEAGIAKAKAIHGRGDTAGAMNQLQTLHTHPLVQAVLRYRLILTDAAHRILLADAEKLQGDQRQAAIERAFQPYLDLFNDEALGERRGPVKAEVCRRWAAELDAGADLATMPMVKRMGIGEILSLDGQALFAQYNQRREAGDEVGDLRQRAVEKLERSKDINRTLIGDEIDREVRVQAMYSLGLAMFLVHEAEEDVAKFVEAGEMLVDAADIDNELPVSEQAITWGISIINQLHQRLREANAEYPGLEELYRRAAGILFEKYPTIEAADNERRYYALVILMNRGRFEEAAEMLEAVPRNHPDYLLARGERLTCFVRLYEREEDESRKQAMRGDVIEQATTLHQMASSALAAAGGAQAQLRARLAMVQARIVQADMHLATRDHAEALAALDGVESIFGQSLGDDERAFLREAIAKRILAYAGAGQLQEALRTARSLMEESPDDAAPVVSELLDELEPRMEDLRFRIAVEQIPAERARMQQELNQMAGFAQPLANMLYTWAQEQPDMTEGEMLEYQLLRIRSMRMARNLDDALDALEPLVKDPAHQHNAFIINEHAETLFAAGYDDENAQRRRDTLVAAFGLYRSLTDPGGGLQREGGEYPPLWWNAQMRMLQIRDRLETNTDTIPLFVDQLRQNDDNLGGPPYRDTIQRIAQKYR